MLLLDCPDTGNNEQLESSLEWGTHAFCAHGLWAHKSGMFFFFLFPWLYGFSFVWFSCHGKWPFLWFIGMTSSGVGFVVASSVYATKKLDLLYGCLSLLFSILNSWDESSMLLHLPLQTAQLGVDINPCQMQSPWILRLIWNNDSKLKTMVNKNLCVLLLD